MSALPIAPEDLIQLQRLADVGIEPGHFESVLDIKDPDHQLMAADMIKSSAGDIVDKIMLAENAGGKKGPYNPALKYKHDDDGRTVAEDFARVYGRKPTSLNELAQHFGEVRDNFTGYPQDSPTANIKAAPETNSIKKDAFIDGRRQTPAQASALEKLLQERAEAAKKGKK